VALKKLFSPYFKEKTNGMHETSKMTAKNIN
jgi:hypothetical protein